jgi:DNA modification methylase
MQNRVKKSSRSGRSRADRQQPTTRDLKHRPRAASISKNNDPLSGLPWPIEMVPLKHLKRAARNVRTHPKKQIEQIVTSIRHFGYIDPVLADENRKLIGGYARADAAERAALRKIPVIVISGLSETEKRALALADNKIAENAGWDRSSLASELNELGPLLAEAGLDLDLTGFQPAEFDALMGDLVDPERDPLDELPTIASESVTCRGDLWLLDHHRLICADATDPDDVRKLMGRERAMMVFADPPYNVKIRNVQGRGRIKHREFAKASGEMSREQFTRFLIESLSLAARYSTNGSIHFICIDWRHNRELQDAGEQVYSETKNLVVWVKTNGGMGTFYRSQHELIFVFKSGQANHVNNFELGQHGRSRTNVWSYAGVNTFRAGRLDDLSVHPTVKPAALVVDAIRDCSRRGDIVLDPFVGSGTTILAAERVGRRGYGLELDPIYVDAAVRRWQAFTKRDAVLAGTDTTFDEVTAARSSKKHARRK